MAEVLTFFSPDFLFSVIRVSTPLLFVALAAMISKRAGIMHIAFESIMLWAALWGVIGSAMSQSVVVGLISGVVFGVFISVSNGFFSMKMKTDLILASIAFNTLATGGTVFVLYLVCRDKGISSSLKSLVCPQISIPILRKIPFLGQVLSGHNILTYLAFVCVPLCYFLLYKTQIGLSLRAVGENPDAAESVGISVTKTRYFALIVSGVLAALGGCFMSMGYLPWFTRAMTAGRGFIGIAAQNIGGGEPLGTLLATLIFGLAAAMSNTLQSGKIPTEIIQMIPYATTLLSMVFYSGKKITKRRKVKNNESLFCKAQS